VASHRPLDAVVVGAGPNGLAAAIRLAGRGLSVLVLEARDTVGGGCRSAELTIPGLIHDVCSAVHPFAASSPFLRGLPLEAHGLEMVHPPAPLAHPFDDGGAVVVERSIDGTSEGLGEDAPAYRRLMTPLASRWDDLAEQILGPPRPPRHPVLLGRFAIRGVRSALALAKGAFRGHRARALFAGLAAHSMLPLGRPLTAGFALALGTSAHAVGWPVARRGSQAIADAMAAYFRSLGGEVATGVRVDGVDEVPPARSVLFDVTPERLLAIAADRFPPGYRRRLAGYRRGPGAFKVDLALDGPIPWRAEECSRAGTVHLGGTIEEIALGEDAVARGEHPDRPFVLLAQPSLFDATRAPAGKHTVWAYCHVPNGSTVDMSERIERQIERFAPGFRDRILARCAMSPADLERYNPNYAGGDIAGGAHDGLQLFARPMLSLSPYATPARGIFICSSATPPGAGVHGMCGYHAATVALKELGG
jgi:phytoene dehydrogenase-like protein